MSEKCRSDHLEPTAQSRTHREQGDCDLGPSPGALQCPSPYFGCLQGLGHGSSAHGDCRCDPGAELGSWPAWLQWRHQSLPLPGPGERLKAP